MKELGTIRDLLCPSRGSAAHGPCMCGVTGKTGPTGPGCPVMRRRSAVYAREDAR